MSFFSIFKTGIGRAAATGLVTASLLASVSFIYETTNTGAPMTAAFEGTVLANYKDSIGVETWCTGETQMGRLETGYTKQYCSELFNARYVQYATQLYGCYNERMKRYVTPNMHAAFTDVYYNTGAKCDTGMMRLLNQGDPVAACDYTLKYKYAGGKDCSDRDNNCYGVYARRLKMWGACVEDAQQLPKNGLGKEDMR